MTTRECNPLTATPSLLSAVLPVIVLLTCSTSLCRANEGFPKLHRITTNELRTLMARPETMVVDTRQTDAFNGWRLDGVRRGGHLSGAVDFSARWVTREQNLEAIAELRRSLAAKGITRDKQIVLYDANGMDHGSVAKFLIASGYRPESLSHYDVSAWADDASLPLERYPQFQLLVPPQAVKELLQGNQPETFERCKCPLFVEVSWGDASKSYQRGHLPKSFHVDTDAFEDPDDWSLRPNVELEAFALAHGFRHDQTVIVSSAEPLAAFRLAVVLRYLGVSDVRVLNGGLDAWLAAGYQADQTTWTPTPVEQFGVPVPANAALINSIEDVKRQLPQTDRYMLVDIRSWEEHLGTRSGYQSVRQKGRVPGAVFGYAGRSGSSSLEFYRNADNTMRRGQEILDLWTEAGVDRSKHLTFMCGGGWRAAEVLTYAQVLGLKDVSLFSDGWIGWSRDAGNPIATGVGTVRRTFPHDQSNRLQLERSNSQ